MFVFFCFFIHINCNITNKQYDDISPNTTMIWELTGENFVSGLSKVNLTVFKSDSFQLIPKITMNTQTPIWSRNLGNLQVNIDINSNVLNPCLNKTQIDNISDLKIFWNIKSITDESIIINIQKSYLSNSNLTIDIPSNAIISGHNYQFSVNVFLQESINIFTSLNIKTEYIPLIGQINGGYHQLFWIGNNLILNTFIDDKEINSSLIYEWFCYVTNDSSSFSQCSSNIIWSNPQPDTLFIQSFILQPQTNYQYVFVFF